MRWTERARAVRVGVLAALMSLTGAALPAVAQGADPNPGALTFTGGFDVPTVYFFRGIRQEADPKITMWPYGDLGIALKSDGGSLKSVSVNVGVWNSLHTGSSGTGGVTRKLHYEEDFYSTASFGFANGLAAAASFVAYTSPNSSYATVKELDVRVSKAGMLAPYALIAFELSDKGQADGGNLFGGKKGIYLELGVAPSHAIRGSRAALALPVRVGLSLKNYYEASAGHDNRFGFFDVGLLATMPLAGVPGRFGSWNLHAGVDLLAFGDTTEALNHDANSVDGDKSKVVALVGIGLTY